MAAWLALKKTPEWLSCTVRIKAQYPSAFKTFVPWFVAKESSPTNLLSSDSPISLFDILSPFVLLRLRAAQPSSLNSSIGYRHKFPLLHQAVLGLYTPVTEFFPLDSLVIMYSFL